MGVVQPSVYDVGMPCWIATHWPHANDDIPWHIYFRKKPKTYPAIGDRVFFYETVVSNHGSPGRGAIVFAANVKDRLSRNVYCDFHTWPFKIDCEGHIPLMIPLEGVREMVSGLFWRHTLTRLDEDQCRRVRALTRGKV
jgi:hypothetical protein